MLSATTRVAVAVVATLLLIGGLGALAFGGVATGTGLWMVVLGAGASERERAGGRRRAAVVVS